MALFACLKDLYCDTIRQSFPHVQNKVITNASSDPHPHFFEHRPAMGHTRQPRAGRPGNSAPSKKLSQDFGPPGPRTLQNAPPVSRFGPKMPTCLQLPTGPLPDPSRTGGPHTPTQSSNFAKRDGPHMPTQSSNFAKRRDAEGGPGGGTGQDKNLTTPHTRVGN